MKSWVHRGLIVIAIGVLGLAACATTHIRSVAPAASFHSARIHRVLIVSIASTPERRKQVEKEFVRQWRKRGVDAVASFDVFPSEVTLDKAGVEPFAKAHFFESVLVARLMKREKIEAQIGYPKEEANLSGYINAVVASPEYGTAYDVVILRTNLYDVATEQLLWSAMSDTLVIDEIPKLVRRFVRAVLDTMYQTP